ncbi:MAG: oligosaccharide flippase family protein [Eubacteriaceae bacterium]|nr:oligosaccharide flippase family protein [Eubacteriaceae bacterium]
MNFYTLGAVKKSIITLAAANMIIGMIEFVFNIYLSRVLGAEGLGLLALVSPINCLFLSFMTEGLVVTISKMSSGNLHFGDYAFMKYSIKVSIGFSFLWSLVLCAIIFLTSDSIASGFLGDPSLSSAILATCPLMMLMSISNIIKGHFLGVCKITVPAAINISEKLLRFPILFVLFNYFLNNTEVSPVAIVYICYAIGELQSVFWLIIYYRLTQKGFPPGSSGRRLTVTAVLKPLILGAAPICLTQCSLEFFNALSSVIVQSRLCSIGLETSEALALLGKYKGMVFPLINYPLILVGAACSIVVPKISTFIAAGKLKAAKRLIRRALLLSLTIGIVTCVIFLLFAEDMEMFFYKRDDLQLMIHIAGLCAPLIYVTATTNSLLISIGKEAQSFRNTLLQQLLLLIGLILFTGIPALNIYGYLLAIACSNAVLLTQNVFVLKKYSFFTKMSQ